MLLITVLVELRLIAGRSRTRTGSPRAVSRRQCCAVAFEKNGMVRAWHGHGMASVNQTRPRCVNQMGKIHSKPLAARRDRGMACARHAMCYSASRVPPFLGYPWQFSVRTSLLRRLSPSTN
jgi:hypothetical protein